MADVQEIVMTAVNQNGKSRMRLERKLKRDIDISQVHHIAGGPYKGILVNKTATSMDTVRPAEGRLEFLAYIRDKENGNGGSNQDYWTLRFWFPQLSLINKNRVMSDYFKELVNPKNMPRNYIGFVKRALVVLREFDQIQRVELEVEETKEPALDDSFGPIQTFISVFTPESFTYQFVPEVTVSNKTFLSFRVKASQDAHIALSAIYGDVDRKTYEIVLGADGNKASYIRDGSLGATKAEAKTINIIKEDDFRYFWISWKDHRVEVGRGTVNGQERFMTWVVPENRRFNVNCISVATSRKSKGEWEFTEIMDEYPEENKVKQPDPAKEARRAKVKIQILWIAKKQRMLQCLEDAYPNTIKTSNIFQLCNIRQGDVISAAVVLKDLQKRGLIREITAGEWVRIPSEEEANRHEVKIVQKLPQMPERDEPRIAIITALYCEKLAVDAMVEDKITYIQHEKGSEGESQVYTLGRIGKSVVVSTKISRQADKQNDLTAAETVSKLLETFIQVKHVLLVGVGGAVPSYNNYNKHVRLGDVVVSVPRDNGAIYVYCSKIDKVPNSLRYNYSAEEYRPHDQTLIDAARSLRHQAETRHRGAKPWETYMEEAMDILKGQESNFHRPSIRTDRLYFTKQDRTVIQCDHPRPTDPTYKDGQTRISYGAVAAGKLVAYTPDLRLDFANSNDIKCFDSGFNSILDRLDGSKKESYLLIRGMSDYVDGSKKEWQCYASLVAAAYMKALILTL
ncbi:uncharacterized protein LOC126829267 [Patella vulgata]|uniref:uncharacterized protein LOC126829267 n=1 Tax=Patella vulgata TaxID=6465 RepID=UPI0024A8A340|nr:uncharacterized protein LOC126829267 [Patella vulgata]